MKDTETCVRIVASAINNKLLYLESSQFGKDPRVENVDITNNDILISGLTFLEFSNGIGYMQERGHVHVLGDGFDNTIDANKTDPDYVPFHLVLQNDGSWHTYNTSSVNCQSEDIIFDVDSGVLFFDGEEIKLSSHSKKTQAHQLLAYLAAHPDEVLDYIHMPYDVFGEIYEWKTYYNIAQDIRDKIAKKTRVMDFIKYTTMKTGNVSISEKYRDRIRVS